VNDMQVSVITYSLHMHDANGSTLDRLMPQCQSVPLISNQ